MEMSSCNSMCGVWKHINVFGCRRTPLTQHRGVATLKCLLSNVFSFNPWWISTHSLSLYYFQLIFLVAFVLHARCLIFRHFCISGKVASGSVLEWATDHLLYSWFPARGAVWIGSRSQGETCYLNGSHALASTEHDLILRYTTSRSLWFHPTSLHSQTLRRKILWAHSSVSFVCHPWLRNNEQRRSEAMPDVGVKSPHERSCPSAHIQRMREPGC